MRHPSARMSRGNPGPGFAAPSMGAPGARPHPSSRTPAAARPFPFTASERGHGPVTAER